MILFFVITPVSRMFLFVYAGVLNGYVSTHKGF